MLQNNCLVVSNVEHLNKWDKYMQIRTRKLQFNFCEQNNGNSQKPKLPLNFHSISFYEYII